MNEKEKQLWLELYEIAEKVKELAPWKYFYDLDLLTYMSDKYKSTFYCSVMGKAGLHKALAIYEEEQVDGFFALAENKYPSYILASYQECISCNFLSKNDTLPENQKLIKELGLRFRGTWISFENFEKGYVPSTINIKQVEKMIDVLQNFYSMLKNLIEHEIKVDFENGFTFYRYYDSKQKAYIDSEKPLLVPKKYYDTISVNDEIIKYMKDIPHTNMELEYDFLHYLPLSIKSKNKGGRYYYPRARFMAERKSGLIVMNDIKNQDDYADQKDYIIESIIKLQKYFEQHGIPKTIYVRNEESKMFLNEFADKLSFTLKVNPKLKAIDRACEMMLRGFMGR